MLHLQGTHQYLINSANQEVSERTFLTPPKPVGYNSFRRHIDLLLLSILRRLLFDVILVNRGKTAMRSGNNTTEIIVQLCFAMRQPHRFLIVKIAGRQRFQPAMHSSKHSVRGSHRWQCHAYTTTSGTLCIYSAAASAASVFPSPMGASITMSPGCLVSRAIRTASSWTGQPSHLQEG